MRLVCGMSCFDCVTDSALFALASIKFFVFRFFGFFFGLFSAASTFLIFAGLGLTSPERLSLGHCWYLPAMIR